MGSKPSVKVPQLLEELFGPLLTFALAGDKGDKRLITLASTKKQLEDAPQFKDGKENGAEMCDPKWIGRVYDYYACPAYWDRKGDAEVKQSSKN